MHARNEERFVIHRAIEPHGRSDFVHTKSGDKRRGFPVAAGNGRMATLALGRTPAGAGHMCVRAGFVDEHQTGDVKPGLVFSPCGAFLANGLALLLAGAQGFLSVRFHLSS